MIKESQVEADQLAKRLQLTPQIVRLIRHQEKDISLMPFGFLRPKFRQISYNLPVIDPETIWSIKKFGTYEEKNN